MGGWQETGPKLRFPHFCSPAAKTINIIKVNGHVITHVHMHTYEDIHKNRNIKNSEELPLFTFLYLTDVSLCKKAVLCIKTALSS